MREDTQPEKFWDGLADLIRPENRRTALILLVSVVVMVTWKTAGSQEFFHRYLADYVQAESAVAAAAWYQMVMAFVLLGVVPACLVRFGFGEPLATVGLGLGRVGAGLVMFAVAAPFLFWIGHEFAASPQFRAVYPLNRAACQTSGAFAAHVASLGLMYLGWEFHFRGFLQGALGKSLGPAAGLWIQVLASCLLHFDRPDAELWASIPAAILWGLQARYIGSIWTGLAQHWFLGATLDFFICE
jgi:membrane protease YdiL (CAAX protease family)